MDFNSISPEYYTPVVGKRISKWTDEEHEKMFIFLKIHRSELIEHFKANISDLNWRNRKKFFISMASFIATKTAEQCKSRFQKQEFRLLKALKIPKELMDSFEIKKKIRSGSKITSEHQASAQFTDDNESIMKSDDQTAQITINTYADLKMSLCLNFLPRIQNEMIKQQIENFIELLPTSSEQCDELPSFNINSLSNIHPQLTNSFQNFKERDYDFFDESI